MGETMMPEVIETTALEAISRADYDVQIATAKKYPMHSSAADIERFIQKGITLATINDETAESCLYAVDRGSKVIQGPSVRMAEIVVAAYGNVKAASRVIDIGQKTLTAQGVCHDLEGNVSQSVEVRRGITYSAGGRYSEDMITVTANAACSIAYRNAVYKVIPAALCERIYQAARDKAIGDVSDIEVFSARRERAIKKFALLGVNKKTVLKKLKRSNIDDIEPDDIALLLGLYNAVKSKEVSIDDAFKASYKPPSGKQKVSDKPAPEPEQAGQDEVDFSQEPGQQK